MKDYLNHEPFMDTISPEYFQRHDRAVDFVNRTYNAKPGISPGLRRILYAVCILALIVAGYFWLR